MENIEKVENEEQGTILEHPVSDISEETGKSEKQKIGEKESKVIKPPQKVDKKVSLSKLASIHIKDTQTIHQRWNNMRDKASGRNFNATTCKDIGLKTGTILYSGKPEESMVQPVAILEIPKIGTQVKIVLLDNVAKKHPMRCEVLNLDNGSLVILGEKKMVGNNLSKENFKTHGWDWLRVKKTKTKKVKK